MVFPYWEKLTATVLTHVMQTTTRPCAHAVTHKHTLVTEMQIKFEYRPRTADLYKAQTLKNPMILNSKDIKLKYSMYNNFPFQSCSFEEQLFTVGSFVKTQGKKVLSWDFCPCPFLSSLKQKSDFSPFTKREKDLFHTLKNTPLKPEICFQKENTKIL